MHVAVRELKKIPENSNYKMSAKNPSQLPYPVYLTGSVIFPSRLPMAVFSREYDKGKGLGKDGLKEIRWKKDFDEFMEKVEVLESWTTPVFERIAEIENFEFQLNFQERSEKLKTKMSDAGHELTMLCSVLLSSLS